MEVSRLGNGLLKLKSSFEGLWRARDELSLKNIRPNRLTAILLPPLAIIMGDLRLLDIEISLGGFDSVTLMLLAYGLGWLICMLLPAERLRLALKIAAVVSLLSFVPQLFIAPGYTQLACYLVFRLANGVCVGCAFFTFCFALNNAERLFIMALVEFYYAFVIYVLWNIGNMSEFLTTWGSEIVMAALLLTVFLGKREDMPSENARRGVDTEKDGGNILFFLQIVYFIICLMNIYLEYESEEVIGWIFGIGSVAGIALVFFVQAVFNKSAWHLWNLYLIVTLLGMAALLTHIPALMNVGSAAYGVADGAGYIAVFYLLGGVGRRSGSLRFFRRACLVTVFEYIGITLVFDFAYNIIDAEYNVIAFTVVLALTCVCFVLAPLLHSKVFNADWSDGYHKLDMDVYQLRIAQTEEIDMTRGLNLTTREKELFTLLLSDAAQKQIADTLGISLNTVRFHSKNLYRKLSIQSRTELLSLYADRLPAKSEQ
jgi:DNA-binding CsgD family transcriptional regulator